MKTRVELGDTFITTDNKVLLNNLRDTNAIFCIQKSAEKVVVTEKELSKSNKAGFGDAIGTTTNRITEMYDVQAGFEKGSPEYNELEKRIMCGQHYQQCAIDKIKGIESKPMPLEWYDSKPNLINISEDGEILDDEKTIMKKEFNMRIVADKKPYFFIYIYPRLKATYNSFIKETSDKCMSIFGCSVEYLLEKDNKTEEEEDFIRYYNIKNPVSIQKSTMNRICRRIEKEFKNVKDKIKSNDYDYSILKNNKEYSTRQFNKIKKIYKEYNNELSKFKMNLNKDKISKDEKHSTLLMMIEDFKVNCMNIIGDEEVLCNILIDLCYSTNKSKQFAWDMCGNQIIKNLLSRCNSEFNYPVKDKNGTIEWMGNKFKMVKGEFK